MIICYKIYSTVTIVHLIPFTVVVVLVYNNNTGVWIHLYASYTHMQVEYVYNVRGDDNRETKPLLTDVMTHHTYRLTRDQIHRAKFHGREFYPGAIPEVAK